MVEAAGIELFRRFAGSRARAVAEYALAERKGVVTRRTNRWNLIAEQDAERLFEDGIRKGWKTGA